MRDYLLGLYEKSMPGTLSLEQKLIEGKIAGFDFMEMSIDETEEKLQRLYWSKEQRKELLDVMYKVNMPIKSICLSVHRKYPLGSLNEKTAERALDIMQRAIDFACELGIRMIQIAGYDEYYNDSNALTEKAFTENLKKSVHYAAKQGVVLGFETMETEFMNTVEKSMKYINKINSPYLKSYLDVGNITNACKSYDIDVIKDIEKGKGHIIAAHLKETVPGKFREIQFGTGHVNFKECIKALRKQEVNLFLAEFWYMGNEMWREDLKKANQFIRNQFED